MSTERIKTFLTSRNGVFVLVGIAAVGIAVGLVVASQVGSGGDKKAAATTATAVEQVNGAAETAALFNGIPQTGNVLGKPDAPVTLIEYADLQCPFCADYSNNVLPAIVQEYVRPGKVKLEFRGMAFLGPDSVTALATVVAAGLQNRLWNVLDLLFRNQGAENSGWVTADLLRSIGGSVAGLDVGKMMDAQGSGEVVTKLADMQSLADASGINSTPSFEIGPTDGPFQRLEVQALDPSAFRPALDAALNR